MEQQRTLLDFGPRRLGAFDPSATSASPNLRNGNSIISGCRISPALRPKTCARARLDTLVAEADAALAPFAAKADTLRAAARFIAERRA